MANLQSSTITDITVNGSLDVNGVIKSSPIGVSGYKSNGGSANTSTGPINWNGIWQNQGMNISNSNSRFTVPEDGYYVITQKNIGDDSGGTSVVSVDINGSNNNSIRSYARKSHNYPMTHSFAIFSLSEGDYIEFDKNSNDLFLSAVDYTQFAIYKIG